MIKLEARKVPFPEIARGKLKQLGECEEIVSSETVNAIGRIVEAVKTADDNCPSSDDLDEDLEEEYHELNRTLSLPDDTYSLTEIKPELPPCVRYGVRSGLIHSNIPKFSPLSRGYQGGAIAIAAFATTVIYKSRCWNEAVIDQIIEDGDTFYCESYKEINTSDRRQLTILDLKRELVVQRKLIVSVRIEEPAYAGRFRSQDPKELHLVKALELFFERYDAGIMTSSVLNVAIWKDAKYYNIFDGQPRQETCEPAVDGISGAAKLFLIKDLMGVLFIVLEKSGVSNEPFVLYSITISGVEPLASADHPGEPEKSLGKPQRRPSGYKVQERFRAVVRSSYHLTHPALPETLRGKGHLIIALAALVYSRLVNANKWTSALIDLIFNQANIYLVDLVRVLGKRLDDQAFELRVDDLMGDIVLGVYSAKVKVVVNVIPGTGKKKGKLMMDSGVREFFGTQLAGILEVKKVFYAIWRQDDTYYLLDPFACDDEGFRIDPADPELASLFASATACVTMNSSIDQLVETILENTGNKDKDPFLIHGVKVLYVKTGITPGGPHERILYREKGTSRRPQALPPVLAIGTGDQIRDMTPRIRTNAEKIKDAATQYPELMEDAEAYMMTDNEPQTYVTATEEDEETTMESPIEDEEEEDEDEEEAQLPIKSNPDEAQEEEEEEQDEEEEEEEAAEKIEQRQELEPIVKPVKGYKVINSQLLILQGTKNCFDEKYEPRSRGRQGLILALTALAYRRLKDPSGWRNMDIDQMMDVSNKAYEQIIVWIQRGRPALKEEKHKEALGEEQEEEEEEEEEEDEGEEELGESEEKGAALQSMPSHLDMTMLPEKLKLANNDVFFKTQMNVIEGNATPLANLAEALECYFNHSHELVLENKKLMYAIWKQDNKIFIFNPYGGDTEGWRLRGYPATLAVTGNLNVLVNTLYGILEFHDRSFIIHSVGLDSIQPGKYVASEPIVLPDKAIFERFETRFLPLTDDNLLMLQKSEVQEEDQEIRAEAQEKLPVAGDEIEDEEEEEEDEEEEEEEEKEEEDKEAEVEAEEEEKPLIDPLLEVLEQDQPDAPIRLNLILLTSNVKIYDREEIMPNRVHEEITMEKLKYSHPPPYVMPPKRTLRTLLDAKRAKESIHSLVSRFTIDSRLEVKKKDGLPSGVLASGSTVFLPVSMNGEEPPSKLIKLAPKKYLYSRMLQICIMPLRAINDEYIQNEDQDRDTETKCTKELEEKDAFIAEEIPDIPTGVRIRPELIPIGPVIKTPTPERRVIMCTEKKKRKCLLPKVDEESSIMEKILCNTEDLLLELFVPDFKAKDPSMGNKKLMEPKNASKQETPTTIRGNKSRKKNEDEESIDSPGFKAFDNEISTIQGNLCIENRTEFESCHFKSCFFSSLLCILGKTVLEPECFRPSILDQFIFLADKIYRYTGKLRYKPYRWFHKIDILDTIFNVVTKQEVYADPENWKRDDLELKLSAYFEKYQTGILAFENSSFAFWTVNCKYYLFDSYSCDEKGIPNEEGSCCLMELPNFESFLERVKKNAGEGAEKYRIYSIFITHMHDKKRKKKRGRKHVRCQEKKDEDGEIDQLPEMEPSLQSDTSLIEISDWVKAESNRSISHDPTIPGFAAIPNYDASMLDVAVLQNEITSPILAPFKNSRRLKGNIKDMDDLEIGKLLVRRRIYERVFRPHSALLLPLDLCIMAWALIHDPVSWSIRTVRGLFEASVNYAFDSVLSSEDSTVVEITDGVLHEFEIANYVFHVVFTPLHFAVLYATEGWNLAQSLRKIFETPTYTGTVLICGETHIGITKRDENYFAWWALKGTKVVRFITSTNLRDFLKLVVKEIKQTEEVLLIMRIITISYAQKVDPDCSDIKGLHETLIPTSSLPVIHKKDAEPYDVDAIFKPSVPDTKPIFVLGTVALTNRDTVKEPKVKRCYFVAILAVMVKRDIIQSPIPGMIDKVLEVGESLYRELSDPKFHTEHILRNVTVMNRIFDFRDCASCLVPVTVNPKTGRNDFYTQVRKHLKKFFKSYTSGVLHFTNCCYGFWYSRGTNCYYYLDPYPCDSKGRKVLVNGKACLCIFPSICQMVKQMCCNQFEETTGFFIHRLHVESINVPDYGTLKEDPMWLYLDYHWNYTHSPHIIGLRKPKTKERQEGSKPEVCQFWNNYAIEVPNLIYSIWGTIGCHDSRFGDRAGKNQAAICVAILAMQYLSHPSKWGPAILDSAVICGDSYYTESLKSALYKSAKHSNKFNLQTCLKIFPHSWLIDFKESICGILYGIQNRMTLASALKFALQDASNLLIECNKITLATLVAKDGYYIADPCWIGPPLFQKDHGAIYVLRCRNMNSLVYAIIKIFNTNQRLDFRITPISLSFQQEDIGFTDAKSTNTKKKKKTILLDPIRSKPGKVNTSEIILPGALTLPEEDSYLWYRKNLTLGIRHGPRLEDPELPCVEPILEPVTATNALISTVWHLNLGQAEPFKRRKPLFDPEAIKHVPQDCDEDGREKFEAYHTPQMSITNILTKCDDYPKTVDFTRNLPTIAKPLDCIAPRDFLSEAAQQEFEFRTKELAHDEYKTYKHRLPKKQSVMFAPETDTEEEDEEEATDVTDDETEAVKTETDVDVDTAGEETSEN